MTLPSPPSEETDGAGAPGTRIGPYRLVRPIGSGGMGVVFEAVHERIGQRAAVKLLSGEPRRGLSTSAVRRFLTEARALSRVEHPGLVRIFECGETPSGALWISMEYVDGELLRARLERRASSMSVIEASRTVRQLGSAVAAIHRAGVVHRDLKPENVMIVPDEEAPGGERVKLLDLGIAKLLDEDAPVTTEGMVLGTAGYMAPEQCIGSAEIDGRADVYALGVLLFELLAGRRPFAGDPASVMRQHLFAEPPRLDDLATGLPPPLCALVRAMMAKEPTLRPSLEIVIEELRALESGGAAAQAPLRARGPRESSSAAAARTEPAPTGAPTLETAPPSAATLPAPPAATAPAGSGIHATTLPATAATTDPVDKRIRNNTEPKGPVTTDLGARGIQSTEAPAPADPPAAPEPRRRGRAILLGLATALTIAALGLAWDRGTRTAAAPVPLPGMVQIAGATFRMGSSDDDLRAACATLPGGCLPEEMPQLQREKPPRDVTVSPFQIDAREVNNAEYATFLEALPSQLEVRDDADDHSPRFVTERSTGALLIDLHPRAGGIERTADGRFAARAGRSLWPVVQVTWDGASRYCRNLGKRLPTEAEWELAARGDTGRWFPWGNDAPRCDAVVFGRGDPRGCPGAPESIDDAGAAPQDVTPDGVRGLAGNAGEWVQDQFTLAYYPDCGDCKDPVVEQPVPAAEDLRIFRGGTFRGAAWFARATTRSRWKRAGVMDGVGFRCASR